AGRVFASRFAGAAGRLLRVSFLGWMAGEVLNNIFNDWDGFKTRMTSLWSDFQRALPPWLGGEGDQEAHGRLGQRLQSWLESNLKTIRDYLNSIQQVGDSFGLWLSQSPFGRFWGLDDVRAGATLDQSRRTLAGMGINLDELTADAQLRAQVPRYGSGSS